MAKIGEAVTGEAGGIADQPPAGDYHHLLGLLSRLDEAGIGYTVRARPDAVRVDVRPPGWRWEIKFSPDGTLAIQRFRAVGGTESDPAVLGELFPRGR